MMTAQRTELLQAIQEISELYPDMRLGQLLCNLASMACGSKPEGVWDAEDEELLPAARQLLDSLRKRVAHVA